MSYVALSIPRELYGIGSDDTDIKLWILPVEGHVSSIIRRRFTLIQARLLAMQQRAGVGTVNIDLDESTEACAQA